MNSVEGRIIKAISGFYYVETTDNTYECKARGSFRKTSKTPVVGDLVTISIPESGYPTVEEIYKRKNSIVRPPMANIDTLVIVCSTVSPAPNYTVIDKMTATAVYNNIEPVIVISKSDIKSGEEIISITVQVSRLYFILLLQGKV
jgi:ribosome biogenesis GTPase